MLSQCSKDEPMNNTGKQKSSDMPKHSASRLRSSKRSSKRSSINKRHNVEAVPRGDGLSKRLLLQLSNWQNQRVLRLPVSLSTWGL